MTTRQRQQPEDAAWLAELTQDTRPIVQIDTTAGGRFHVSRLTLVAAIEAQSRDVPLCDVYGEPVVTGHGTLRTSTIRRSPMQIIEAAAHQVQPVQPTATPEPPPAEPPKRSALTQIGRWLTGEDRRERDATQAQAEAAAAEAAAAAAAKAERQEQFRVLYAKIMAGIESSALPLVHFSTFAQPPERHYAWREHWLEMQGSGGQIELPLCDRHGDLLTNDQGEVRTVSALEVQWQTLYSVDLRPPPSVENDLTLNAEVLEVTQTQSRGPSR